MARLSPARLLAPLRCLRPSHIGRRGASLLFLALIWFTIGLSLLSPLTPVQRAALSVLFRFPFSQYGWAWLWMATGLLSLVGAFAKRLELAAFAASAFLILCWALGYLAAWLLGQAPRGWLGFAVYGGFSFFIFLIAGWPEPPPLRPPGRRARPPEAG